MSAGKPAMLACVRYFANELVCGAEGALGGSGAIAGATGLLFMLTEIFLFSVDWIVGVVFSTTGVAAADLVSSGMYLAKLFGFWLFVKMVDLGNTICTGATCNSSSSMTWHTAAFAGCVFSDDVVGAAVWVGCWGSASSGASARDTATIVLSDALASTSFCTASNLGCCFLPNSEQSQPKSPPLDFRGADELGAFVFMLSDSFGKG